MPTSARPPRRRWPARALTWAWTLLGLGALAWLWVRGWDGLLAWAWGPG